MPIHAERDEIADPHDLERFVQAQEGDYARALSELQCARKRSHWMWYIFPQFQGLGHSMIAERYAIRSAAEASAYLRHPVLGPRLVTCAEAVLVTKDRSAREIFGAPDDLKLRSSATLFAHVSPPESVFHQVLEHYFDSEPDQKTLALLDEAKGTAILPLPRQ